MPDKTASINALLRNPNMVATASMDAVIVTIWTNVTTGLTLDEIGDTFTNLDELEFSLDDPAWSNGEAIWD